MRILVTFALENEFAPWRDIRKFRADKWGQAPVLVTDIGGAEVGVILTGAGPRPAASEASKVVWGESGKLEICISTGLAGALRPGYEIGQVLAARAVVSEAVHPESQDRAMPSSPAMISFAEECGAITVNAFCTTARVVTRPDEKRHLGTRADAVEMESFEVLRSAAADGVPAAAIRAVSDTVDENLPPDMQEVFNDEGRVSIPRLMGHLARHPSSVPSLMRFGKQASRAAESLAEFLEKYIPVVAVKMKSLEVNSAVGS